MSLRDMYSSPSTSWHFDQAASSGSFRPSNASNASTSSSGHKALASNAEVSYQWSSRPQRASSLGLGIGVDDDEASSSSMENLGLGLALEFASTALAMPWEVGRVLLQVQYLPKGQDEDAADTDEGESEEEGEDGTPDNEDYFMEDEALSSSGHQLRQTDEQGYVTRKSVSERATRADYVLPPGSIDGIWAMIKRLVRWKPEGWLSLWKGLTASWAIDALSHRIPPIMYGTLSHLSDLLGPSPAPLAYPYMRHNAFLSMSSHVLTGLLLSPLDLIRTRLIVQSSLEPHTRYAGPLDALKQILRDEGGFRSMYLHPQLLIPAFLDCTLRTVLPHLMPSVISLLFPTIDQDTHPFRWGTAMFIGNCASLLLTMPIETIRRRLQVQTRGSVEPLKTCVEVRPKPYYGVVDTLYSVLTEERSDYPLRTEREQRAKTKKGKGKEVEADTTGKAESSWMRNTGVGQLYHGLSMRITIGLVLLLGRTVAGSPSDDGWTEL